MRDDFTESVKRLLAFRVSTTCSNPGCQADTSGAEADPTKAANVGVAAHITSAAPGGPRFNPDLSSEQRSSTDNGIWLCQTCSRLIDDDVIAYPEKVLRAWKDLAEHHAMMNVGRPKIPLHESEAQKKAREILKWKSKYVVLVKLNTGRAVALLGLRAHSSTVKVIDCNEHFVRVKGDAWETSRSLPLNNVELGHDDRLDCLELLERNP